MNKLVAGNWKMYGLSADLPELRAIAEQSQAYPKVDVALCVPAILIERAVRTAPGFAIGAQDVHEAPYGAHTGSVSAGMLIDAGARLTIVVIASGANSSAKAMPTLGPRPQRRSVAALM